MPATGTFLRSPYVERPVAGDADVAIVGIPYDEGTTWRAGTREGPRALRAASTNWAYRRGSESYLDGEAGVRLLEGIRFVDTGDVAIPPQAPVEVVQQRVLERLSAVVRTGMFPVVLGGDHSVTYPVLRAVTEARAAKAGRAVRPLHLVHFDAHMDYWEDIGLQRFTHASPIIRSHEAGLVDGITQYGIRGLHTAEDNLELAAERGVVTFWCEQAKQRPLAELVEHLPQGVETWLTFDIDCLDPAIAPGTGTPEPGGFTYYEAKALLLAVAERVKIVGMDLVEVNPLYDPAELAALHGARLILDTVGAVWRSPHRT